MKDMFLQDEQDVSMEEYLDRKLESLKPKEAITTRLGKDCWQGRKEGFDRE